MSATPTPYTPATDFEDLETNDPELAGIGSDLDTEFANLATSISTTQSRLAEIQRDDGALKNAIVTPDSLSAATRVLMTAGISPETEGEWEASHDYDRKDLVTHEGATYMATTGHTSSADFATDLAAGKWLLIASPYSLSSAVYSETFDGDGVTTVFALSQNFTSINELLVFVQDGSAGYELMRGAGTGPQVSLANGNELTFATAPTNGTRNILVLAINQAAATSAAQAIAAQEAAEAAQEAAEDAAESAENIQAAINNRYYGALSSDPVTRPDGTPVQPGDLYTNSVTNTLRFYTSAGTWQDAVAGSITDFEFVGDGATTDWVLPVAPSSKTNVILYVGAVPQSEDAFDLNGMTLKIDPPVANGVKIFGKIINVLGIGVPGDGTVTAAKTDFIVQQNVSISVGASGDYATLKVALQAIAHWIIPPAYTVTITLAAEHFSDSENIKLDHPYASQIVIQGESPASVTITGVHDVTGSTGDWDVTYQLSDVTGLSVGDVLTIGVEDLVASTRLLWDVLRADIVAGTTNMTVAGSGVVANRLVHVLGQSRHVSTYVDPDLDTSTNWTHSISNYIYWYYQGRTSIGSCNTGGSSSTTLTGASTTWNTAGNGQAFAGNLIFPIGDGGPRQITAVGGNTSLTMNVANTVSNASQYSIVPLVELHCGAWEITDVDTVNNRITVKNKCAYSYGPPKNTTISGTGHVLKSVLRADSNAAIFNISSGRSPLIKNIGMVHANTGGSSNHFNLTGSDSGRQSAGDLVLDGRVGLVGGYIGIRARGSRVRSNGLYIGNTTAYALYGYGGASFECWNTFIASAQNIGVLCVNSTMTLTGSTICGCDGIGLYAGPNGEINANSIRLHGNNGVGAYFISNSGGHMVEARAWCNSNHGIQFDSFSGGRASGAICLANGGSGLVCGVGSGVECQSIWCSGNASIGLYALDRGAIEARNAALNGNGSHGAQADHGGHIRFTGGFARYNLGFGVYAYRRGQIFASAAWIDDNTTNDYKADKGAWIDATSPAATSSYDPAVNTLGNEQSYIDQ